MAETQFSPESRVALHFREEASSPPGLRRLRFPFFTINLSKSKPLSARPADCGSPGQQDLRRTTPVELLAGSSEVWRPVRGIEASVPRDTAVSTQTPSPCQHPFSPLSIFSPPGPCWPGEEPASRRAEYARRKRLSRWCCMGRIQGG